MWLRSSRLLCISQSPFLTVAFVILLTTFAPLLLLNAILLYSVEKKVLCLFLHGAISSWDPSFLTNKGTPFLAGCVTSNSKLHVSSLAMWDSQKNKHCKKPLTAFLFCVSETTVCFPFNLRILSSYVVDSIRAIAN